MFDAGSANTSLPGASQAKRIGAVTEHDREVEIQTAVGNAIDECLQIGARSGNQDGGITTGHQR